MKIRSIIDAKGEHLVVDYSVMADGSYLCAIKGFVEPFPKNKIGMDIRSDLGVGQAKTRYYALDKAEAAFFKKYTADHENKIMELGSPAFNIF